MLLESSVAKVPLGATAPAAAVAECSCTCDRYPPRACVILMLVFLEQSSDRGPVSVFSAVQ